MSVITRALDTQILEQLNEGDWEQYSVRGLLLSILITLKGQTGGGGGGGGLVLGQIGITTIAATQNIPKALGLPGAKVYWAVVQNISQSDITFTNSPGSISPGFILNKAATSTSAGDSFTFVPPPGADVIDLGQISFNYPGAGTVNAIALVTATK